MANEVSNIYSDIADLLNLARAKAYHVVNFIMIETFQRVVRSLFEEHVPILSYLSWIRYAVSSEFILDKY